MIDFFRNATFDAHCGLATVLASSSRRYQLSCYKLQASGTASPDASLARSLMHTPLDYHEDLGSMDTYSPASQCSSPLSHQASQLPRHDQDEISGFSLRKKWQRSNSTVSATGSLFS